MNWQEQFEEVKLLVSIFIIFGVVIPLFINVMGNPYNIASAIPIIVALLLITIGISKRE